MDVKIYDKLAKKYDFMVNLVSFGIEEIWRRLFVREIRKYVDNGVLIDVASATGKMAKSLNFDRMYLIEPSEEMVKVIIENFKKLGYIQDGFRLKKGNKEVFIIKSTAEDFEIDEKADLIVSFMGIRNFDDIKKGIENLDRHLKVGGYFGIVEMVKRDDFFGKLVLWYMNKVVPFVASFFGMRKEYEKLGESVASLSEEDILANFKEYDIIVNKSLFPVAKMFILKKER
jgi:ubiquinone/menaquinone biosynthesis C-methylase UbiE